MRLLHEGESPTQIARFLGCARSAVYKWKAKEQAEGPAGLAAKAHPGREPRLSAAQLHELDGLLRQGSVAHGWKTNLWTATRVAALIERHFGVHFHPEHVRKILRWKLGWTSQKPEKRARERDEQAIQRWVEERFPQVKKKPNR
jgi:transposase